MKKSIKRLLTVALTGAMAVSMLAGCGKEKQKTSDAASGDFTGNISKTAAGIEGWSKFEKQVTLKVPVYQRAKPNGAADAANNYWTQWVQKEFGDKYNIKVEYVALARGDENNLYL